MRVIVVGGTALPRQLALALGEEGCEVTRVANRPEREDLPDGDKIRVVHGDPLVPLNLELAGARRSDVLVACTRSDESNLALALLAKRLFAVPRVVARVNDLANRWMFDASWGVDEVVAPAALLASLIVTGEPQGTIAVVTS